MLVIAAVFYLVAIVEVPTAVLQAHPQWDVGDQAACDRVGPGAAVVNVGGPRGAPQNQSGKTRP